MFNYTVQNYVNSEGQKQTKSKVFRETKGNLRKRAV